MKVVPVIALGGVLGAACRYGVGAALPTTTGAWPWSTLIVNATGCLLIGVLMVLVEVSLVHRLARPFLGVGVLAGFTTFSTYAVDAQTLLVQGRPALALGYLVATPVVALLAVGVGVAATRALVRHHGPHA